MGGRALIGGGWVLGCAGKRVKGWCDSAVKEVLFFSHECSYTVYDVYIHS